MGVSAQRVARVRIQTDWCNAVLLPMPAAWAALPPRDRRRTDVALGAWKPFVLQDVRSSPHTFYTRTSSRRLRMCLPGPRR